MSGSLTEQRNIANWLAYLGLLPFVLALITLLLFDDNQWSARIRFLTTLYAALIVTFVGAIHWGVLLNHKSHPAWMYVVSVLPFFTAMLALILPFNYGIAILFLTLLALQVYEKKFLWAEYFPVWFQQLRSRLNFAVSGILLLIWLISLN